jgi:hypothetical protein
MDSIQLYGLLTSAAFNFKCEDPERSKAYKFKIAENSWVYIKNTKKNKDTPDTKPVSTRPLVIHPKFLEQKDVISSIDGISGDLTENGFVKSTGFGEFPRPKDGTSPYGLALDVKSPKALHRLLNILFGLEQTSQNPDFSIVDDLAEEVADETYFVHEELDSEGVTKRRNEQTELRKVLLKNQETGSCTLCHRIFPKCFLVAAHIKPRNLCNDYEKRDLNVATLMCKTGCDDAFENGYVTVQNGIVIKNNLKSSTPALDQVLASAIGKSVANSDASKVFYDFHNELHLSTNNKMEN